MPPVQSRKALLPRTICQFDRHERLWRNFLHKAKKVLNTITIGFTDRIIDKFGKDFGDFLAPEKLCQPIAEGTSRLRAVERFLASQKLVQLKSVRAEKCDRAKIA